MTTESSWSSSKTCLTLTPASLLSSDDAMGWLVRMQQAIKEQLTYPSLTQEERFHLVFSFAPPVVGLATPEITKGSSRFAREK